MQHVGDDGSRESEHDVGGIRTRNVAPKSRLRACERIDVRQSGASQTETIDGLVWLEQFKDAKEAYGYPKSDDRGVLMTPVIPGPSSFL